MDGKSWILERMKAQGLLKTQDGLKEPELKGRSPDFVIFDDVYQDLVERIDSLAMTTNKPNDPTSDSFFVEGAKENSTVVPLVRLTDYEALQTKYDSLPTFSVGTDLSDEKLTVVVSKNVNDITEIIHSEVIQLVPEHVEQQPTSNDKVRAEFEAWAVTEGYPRDRMFSGHYVYAVTSAAWEAWQASRTIYCKGNETCQPIS